jgi:hypothetical protein
MEGFHGSGGLTVQRTPEGVRIRWYDGERLVKSTEWDVDTWASAVASVSRTGEDANTFQQARNFWLYGDHRTPTGI